MISQLSQPHDRHDVGLSPADEPLRKQVENGEDDGEVQGEVVRDVDGDQCIVQRVGKVRAVELVVRLGKGVLSDDIGRQSHPSAAQTHDAALVGGIGGQAGAQLGDLGVDDGLEICDIGDREEGADGLAALPVEVVVDGREPVASIAKAPGEVAVLVAPPRPARVQLLVVVGVVNMELGGRDAHHRAVLLVQPLDLPREFALPHHVVVELVLVAERHEPRAGELGDRA